MNIRLLNPDDAEAYWSLRLFALQESPDAFSSTWEEAVNRPDPLEQTRERLHPDNRSFTMGAFQEERLVGVVTIVREQQMKLRHKANLYAMYVLPDMRGKGVAKELIRQAIQHAQTLMEGLEQINLTVNAHNRPARNLYASLGFVSFGCEQKAMKSGDTYSDEEWMKLFLA